MSSVEVTVKVRARERISLMTVLQKAVTETRACTQILLCFSGLCMQAGGGRVCREGHCVLHYLCGLFSQVY